MKLLNLILIEALIAICAGQGTQLGWPDLLTATLVRILSTRDPTMFDQNRAQTLTAIGAEQPIESVLTALSPTLTYTFYSLNKKAMSHMEPRLYWTQVVLVVFKETDIRRQLPRLFRHHVWLRPQHIILVVNVESLAIDPCMLDYMNTWMADKKIYNVVFIYNVFGRIQVFASEPFLSSGPSDRSNFFKYSDLFYDKTRNLDGYELAVLLVPDMPRVLMGHDLYSGIDGRHLTILLGKINATYRVETMFDDVQRFDIVFNMLPINWTTRSFTYMYEIEELCFIVKRGPRQILASDMAGIFRANTWLTIFTVFFTCGGLWHVYHLNEPVTGSDTLYFMFQAQAQQPVYQHARTLFEHIFIYTFTLYACMIIVFVRSRIYALLIAPGIEEPYTTVAEVLDRNDEIYTSKWVYESMEYMYGREFVRPFRTFERKYLFDYSATATVFLLPRWEIEQIVGRPQNIYNSKDQMWYVVKECLHARPRSYSLEPGSPFVVVFNKYMLWMQETGLVQGMAKVNHWPVVGSPMNVDKTSVGISVWQFRHAFFMLAAGLSVATMVFMLEILLTRIRSWWRCIMLVHLPLFDYTE